MAYLRNLGSSSILGCLTNRIGVCSFIQERGYALKYWGYAEKLETVVGPERKEWLSIIKGDGKVMRRTGIIEPSTEDTPNLVPMYEFNDRSIACKCKDEETLLRYTWIRRGVPKRCMCGHWFMGVDADPDSMDLIHPKYYENLPK